MKQLKEAIFKEAYHCEQLAFEAFGEYDGCFEGFKCIVDDEVLKEKEKKRIACSAMAETFLNFISENGLSNEYERFKIRML